MLAYAIPHLDTVTARWYSVYRVHVSNILISENEFIYSERGGQHIYNIHFLVERNPSIDMVVGILISAYFTNLLLGLLNAVEMLLR